MRERISRYDEMVLWIVRRPESVEPSSGTLPVAGATDDIPLFGRIWNWMDNLRTSAPSKTPQIYDVWLYTDLETACLNYPPATLPETVSETSNLKLPIRREITIAWEYYREYLASFFRGETAAYKKFWGYLAPSGQGSALCNKIFQESLLESLIGEDLLSSDRPSRVWLNCTPPELAELPWELLACGLRTKKNTRFSFVRGLPPAKPLLRVTVQGRLRLAFVHDPERTSEALKATIDGLKSTLDVVEMTEAPRDALQRAAKEGFELIHLVTDGAVSLGHEGLLYLRKSPAAGSKGDELNSVQRHMYRLALNYSSYLKYLVKDKQLLEWNDRLVAKLEMETCSASELSATLHGSRVALLSLSTEKSNVADTGAFEGALLPSVYRAFASLGSSTVPLPNILAPIGPYQENELENFWSTFYERLADPRCYSVEEATAFGLQKAPTALMALFLRQRLGREFTERRLKIGATSEEPNRANARLQVARSLVEQLRAIDASYKDIDSKIADTPLVKSETEQQNKLEQEISPLTELDEEER